MSHHCRRSADRFRVAGDVRRCHPLLEGHPPNSTWRSHHSNLFAVLLFAVFNIQAKLLRWRLTCWIRSQWPSPNKIQTHSMKVSCQHQEGSSRWVSANNNEQQAPTPKPHLLICCTFGLESEEKKHFSAAGLLTTMITVPPFGALPEWMMACCVPCACDQPVLCWQRGAAARC